mmetsp:Transcript_27546/g.67936  ORF Transcript_27546/g.67936 Transcript_27546/m.67936 type:complete len:283 (+) Transcript_27546:1214-2062(+)
MDDLAADAASGIICALDVRSMCRLAGVSVLWRSLVRADEAAWRERAREIGLTERLPGCNSWINAVAGGWSVCVGDAFEVEDTYEMTAVARVMAVVNDSAHGPLLLCHFEGWSESWFMWLHRQHDQARIRPLTAALPGIGSAGFYNEQSYRDKLDMARQRLAAGSAWPPTRGRPRGIWPWPYQQGRPSSEQPANFTISITDPHAWLLTQKERPFCPCAELAASPSDCLRAWCAATLSLAADLTEAPVDPAGGVPAEGGEGGGRGQWRGGLRWRAVGVRRGIPA